jgi:hypothetical protein
MFDAIPGSFRRRQGKDYCSHLNVTVKLDNRQIDRKLDPERPVVPRNAPSEWMSGTFGRLPMVRSCSLRALPGLAAVLVP